MGTASIANAGKIGRTSTGLGRTAPGLAHGSPMLLLDGALTAEDPAALVREVLREYGAAASAAGR